MREFDSAEPLFAFDTHLRICSWNKAAEQLTGIPPEEAIGRYCFEVISGRAADGTPICGPGCSYARDLVEGRPAPLREVWMRTLGGPRRLSLSLIAVRGDQRPVFLHVMRATEAQPAPSGSAQPRVLSARQRQVLGLLAAGLRAREIARDLSIAETTVRNHIREILARLGCHSQLEVVAKLWRGEIS